MSFVKETFIYTDSQGKDRYKELLLHLSVVNAGTGVWRVLCNPVDAGIGTFFSATNAEHVVKDIKRFSEEHTYKESQAYIWEQFGYLLENKISEALNALYSSEDLEVSYIDIPHHPDSAEEEQQFTSVAEFEYVSEAVQYCQEKFGADIFGRVRLISNNTPPENFIWVEFLSNNYCFRTNQSYDSFTDFVKDCVEKAGYEESQGLLGTDEDVNDRALSLIEQGGTCERIIFETFSI